MNPSALPPLPPVLSRNSRALVLFVAFLGWLCAGVHMSITQLIGQAAAIDLLAQTGSLDAARYHALTKRAQRDQTLIIALAVGQAGSLSDPWLAGWTAETMFKARKPLSLFPEDQAQLQAWKEMVGRWFA